MKTLVIYYSLTGNTKYIADALCSVLSADAMRLPHKGARPVLEAYDLIVIGTPVWAFGLPYPLKKFLKEICFDGRRVALFCCYTVCQGRVFAMFMDALQHAVVVGQHAFREPLRISKEQQADEARSWASELRDTNA
jgi:flavodoxin